MVAKGGGLFRLPKRMPYHVVMELALLGEVRPAEFFHGYGLVNRLVEAPGQAVEEAKGLARRMLRNGPLALSVSKEIIARSYDWSDEEGWKAQVPIVDRAMSSADAREGVAAFVEKRPPVWSGR